MPRVYRDPDYGVSFRELPDGNYEIIRKKFVARPRPKVDLRWPAWADETEREATRIFASLDKLAQSRSGRLLVDEFYSRLGERRAYMIERRELSLGPCCRENLNSLQPREFSNKAWNWLQATCYPDVRE